MFLPMSLTTTIKRCCANHRWISCARLHTSATQLCAWLDGHDSHVGPYGGRGVCVVQHVSCERDSRHTVTKSSHTDILCGPSFECSDHHLSHQRKMDVDVIQPCLTESYRLRESPNCSTVSPYRSSISPHLTNYAINSDLRDTVILDNVKDSGLEIAKETETLAGSVKSRVVSCDAFNCDRSPIHKHRLAVNRIARSPHSAFLSRCDFPNVLAPRKPQFGSCIKRSYSHLSYACYQGKHSISKLHSNYTCKKLLVNHENVYSHGEGSIRTNYTGQWQGPGFRQKPPWRVLFFGTDSIALDTLKAMHENMRDWSSVVGSLDVVTVQAQKPVRQYAESVGLPLYDWPIETDNSKYDVGVLVSFGHMIPDKVIHMFPYGILNMHPSLLPRWRGASPIIHAVLAGDREMGVSITEIRPKHFDIGPILMQRVYPMPNRPTSLQVADVLGKVGANMVLETLQDLPTLERFEHEQDIQGITYAHKISKQNGYVDWENSSAVQVDRQYRALSSIVPIRTMWKDVLISLHDIIDPDNLKDAQSGLHPRFRGNINEALPGTPAWHRDLDCIVIKCKIMNEYLFFLRNNGDEACRDESSLFLRNGQIRELCPTLIHQANKEGLIGFKTLTFKRLLTARDFHNGYLNAWDGTRFTSVHNELYRYVKTEKMPVTSAV